MNIYKKAFSDIRKGFFYFVMLNLFSYAESLISASHFCNVSDSETTLRQAQCDSSE
tara:strand:- start:937 stop:1104 length:168 start_codon:yes stop_codon:yes gene_type:complete